LGRCLDGLGHIERLCVNLHDAIENDEAFWAYRLLGQYFEKSGDQVVE
jgi:hypothetical protein